MLANLSKLLSRSNLSFVERRPAHALAVSFSQFREKNCNFTDRDAYRTSLVDYVTSVSNSLVPDESIELLSEDSESLQLLHEKAMWDILSILFVHATHSDTTTLKLKDWYKTYYKLYNTDAETCIIDEIGKIIQLEVPEDDPCFWRTFVRAVSLGWYNDAIQLLQANSLMSNAFQKAQLVNITQLFKELIRLLKLAPIYCTEPLCRDAIGTFVDSNTFHIEREKWQSEVVSSFLARVQLLPSADMSAKSALTQVANILLGNREAIVELDIPWPEQLFGEIFHLYPDQTAKSQLKLFFEYHPHVTLTEDAWHVTALLDILQGFMMDDMQSVLQVCSQTASWLSGHMPNLLKNWKASTVSHLECCQDEFFLLEYVTLLSACESTWHLALTYLAWCPIYGEAITNIYLLQVAEVADELTLLKLLRFCDNSKLMNLKYKLCLMQGHVFLENGLSGNALVWYLRSKDLSYCEIAMRSLFHCIAFQLKTNEMYCEDVFAEMDNAATLLACADFKIPVESSLHFLTNYKNWYNALYVNDIEAIAKAKSSLVDLSNLLVRQYQICSVPVGLLVEILHRSEYLLCNRSIKHDKGYINTLLVNVQHFVRFNKEISNLCSIEIQQKLYAFLGVLEHARVLNELTAY